MLFHWARIICSSGLRDRKRSVAPRVHWFVSILAGVVCRRILDIRVKPGSSSTGDEEGLT